MSKQALKDRRDALSHYFKAPKNENLGEIELLCSHIREFAEDLDEDATIPGEVKKEMKKNIDSILEIVESEEFATDNGKLKKEVDVDG